MEPYSFLSHFNTENCRSTMLRSRQEIVVILVQMITRNSLALCVDMEYLQEHELGDKPVRLDMLLLKKESVPLVDPLGSFFRIHNVLDYKSPEDGLTIDDFYKAQGYALIYKSLGKTVNAIPLHELTVSIFRHADCRKANMKLSKL